MLVILTGVSLRLSTSDGVGSNSAATVARSKGSAGAALPGLNTPRDEAGAAGVLRPREDAPEGGGGRRPFWK